MTTNNEKIKTIVKVNKLTFVTNLKGFVTPLFYICKNDDLINKKIDINGILFDSIEPLEKGIGVGSELLVEFDKNGTNPNVKEIISKTNKPVKLPEFCKTCKHTLRIKKDSIKCINVLCPATSRGHLYQLFKLSSCATIADITDMLDKYPIAGDGPGSIDTLEEFKIAFYMIKDKNTQSRLNHWTNIRGNSLGNYLWDIESQIVHYLNMESFEAKDFWTICNFKNLTNIQLSYLSTVNPKVIATGNIEINHLPSRVRELIEVNLDIILWLVNFFEITGDKKWKTLEIF